VDAKPNLKNAFKRAFSQFSEDDGPDLAAALTYFAVLSLFPAMLALSSLLGLFGDSDETIGELLKIAADLGAPESTLTRLEEFVRTTSESGGAGVALIIGVAGALFSASNYVNAFTRAMNKVYGVEEGRPFWKLRPWTYLITIVLVIGVLVVVTALVLSGGIAEAVGNVIGLGPTAVMVWNIAKWPVVVLIVMLLVAFLYWATPNVRPKFRVLSVGAAFAIVVWALATAAFGLYLASDLATYNATYGALAGVIIMLVWLWITNIVLVLGGEVDAELERSRELQAGMAAEEQIQLPLRDRRKVDKKSEKYAEAVAERRRIRMEAARRDDG
jgi:membrane protein